MTGIKALCRPADYADTGLTAHGPVVDWQVLGHHRAKAAATADGQRTKGSDNLSPFIG